MIVGIDVGGTKTHVCVENDGESLLDLSVPTAGWQRDGLVDHDENAERLVGLFAGIEASADAPLVVGAHGLDNEAQTVAFNEQLAACHGGPAVAVNDVQLVGPAAGYFDAIAVIAGTGSKVVGQRADGSAVNAGGYGFLLNDPGSAPALVRDAVRRLFDAADGGEPDDGLAAGLFRHFGVHDVVGLSNALTLRPQHTTWGAAAPLVFSAADAGSSQAQQVIRQAAGELASSVELVHRRGAVGTDVVCAGGVITNQPRLFDALAEELRARGLPHRLHLLDVPPVLGALALARRLAEAATVVPFATPTPSRRKS